MTTLEITDGCEYVVGDAAEVLGEYAGEAAAVFLDDAWAWPERITRFEIDYAKHPFDDDYVEEAAAPVDTSVTTAEILDASRTALVDGGWLVADAEDWLVTHLLRYLTEEWGDAAQTDEAYEGGGYRKLGGVTYVDEDGEPSRDTDGSYLSAGGYPVVFAHKGRTDRRTNVSARQLAQQASGTAKDFGWESIKPIGPYEAWIEALVEPGELILVPCAGTAPAALAAERVFGDDARYVCVDKEEGALEAFRRRRDAELRDGA